MYRQVVSRKFALQKRNIHKQFDLALSKLFPALSSICANRRLIIPSLISLLQPILVFGANFDKLVFATGVRDGCTVFMICPVGLAI